jgi:uncharacterized protein (TIGR03083 family)
MTDLATYVAALEQCWQGVASACTNLTPAQWDGPTDLSGWSVKDNVSHIVGVEAHLLGEPQPDHTLPEGLPHVTNEFRHFMEVQVDVRRYEPGDVVLGEFRDVTKRRLEVLRGYTEDQLDVEMPGIFGPAKLRHILAIRVFDCWTHEQDVRRALGHPGGLDTPGAHLSLRRLLHALTGLAEDVPAAAGRTLVVTTTGAVPSVSTLRFGEDKSYADGDTAGADARITADFETFLRIGTGRVAYDDVSDEVRLEGDTALAAELLRHASVTP